MHKKIFSLLIVILFCSHDMYLKMDTYFIEPNKATELHLYNGTFEKSENIITRDRMLDVSLVGNGKRRRVSNDQWTEKDSITVLSFQSGEPGTWVAGVSTAARNIEMDAEAFNKYLEHDGVLDMLKIRRDSNTLDQDAVEKYSKHVKAIFQVGADKTADWSTELGYPIEFVPLKNPYELNTGDTLQVKLLFKGEPLSNQFVYADYQPTVGGHAHNESDHGHAHRAKEQGHTHDASTNKHSHENSAEPHSHQKELQSHGDRSENHSHNHEDTVNGESHSHDDSGKEHIHDEENGHQHSHSKDGHTHENKGSQHLHSHETTDAHDHSHNKEGDHLHEEDKQSAQETHQHTSGEQLRTDETGVLNLNLRADGIWYLRTIHLVTIEEEGLTHESNWATLTFEVTHGHAEGSDHTHEEDEGSFPTYLFWIGSAVILGGLFFWFNRKK